MIIWSRSGWPTQQLVIDHPSRSFKREQPEMPKTHNNGSTWSKGSLKWRSIIVNTNTNTRTHTNTRKNVNTRLNSLFTFHGLEEVAGGALDHAGHLLPAEPSHLVKYIPWFSNNLELWELEQTGSSLAITLFLPNRASRVIKVIKGLQVKLFLRGRGFTPFCCSNSSLPWDG